jgi:hypothetical protein
MKHITILCTLLLVALFAIGCGEQEVPVVPGVSSENLGSATLAKRSDPIEFIEGRTTFGAYLPRINEYLINPEEMYCLATATLEFEDGHKIVLTLTEGEPCSRESELVGTLTPGGRVKLTAPDWWIDEVTEHTGCTLSGTFPVYHGYFDGHRLYASSQFHGLCTGGNMWGPVFGVSEEMGPIHVTFGIDLTTDE